MSENLIQTNNSLEIQLILKCSKIYKNKQDNDHISQLLNQPLDWDFILDVAGRNGLLPLVCWRLLQNFADILPSETRNLLTQFFQVQTRKNLVFTRKLIETVNILKEVGIPILPFKGTTLAMQAYGNLALRHYSDLDVLVQPKHFDEAVKVLTEHGYTPIGKINWLKRKILFFNNKKDVGLLNKEENVRIELHWKLSGAHFAMPLEISDLWDRLERLNLGGTELYALPLNDLFVYLCLHGSRHGWEKFAWICDLHELILTKENSGGEINWIEIQQHAKNLGCEKVVELGLFLVDKFFNLRTNYPDFEQIKNNPAYKTIAEQIEQKCFSKDKGTTQIGDWYLYHLSLREKETDKWKLHLRYFFWYLRIIFRPNALDKSVFHMPTIFYPLYYILRPLRLLFNYFSSDAPKKKISG